MKKLLGLLFEDEEVVEEEFIVEPTSTPLPLSREEKKPVQQALPIQNHGDGFVGTEQGTLTRVSEESDGLTIHTNKPNVKEEPKPEAKKISMNVDELVEAKTVPAKQKRDMGTQMPRGKATKAQGYDFTPVISPIFGVDEKIANAVTPTTTMKKAADSHIGTIISPMYGMDKEAEPTIDPVAHTHAKPTESEMSAERDMVNLTLDDILARTAAISGKKNEDVVHFDVDSDEDSEEFYSGKKVINTRNMSLFDDEGE